MACLLLSDPSGQVRAAAAKALAALGDSGRPYASAVAMQLNDIDPETRSEALAVILYMRYHNIL